MAWIDSKKLASNCYRAYTLVISDSSVDLETDLLFEEYESCLLGR